MSAFYFEILIPSPRNVLYFLYLIRPFVVPYYCPFTLAPDAFNDDLEMYGKGIYLKGLFYLNIETHFILISDLHSAFYLLLLRGIANLHCLPNGSLR